MVTAIHSYSTREEKANAATHAAGLLLSIAALVLLIVFSFLHGDGWHIFSTSIFGASLIVLYTSSTLYHIVTTPEIKKIFQTLDHSSIFVLIAGTYTPFTLVSLRGLLGWTIFALVWTIAIGGILLETMPRQKFRKLSLALYLGMGWLIVFAIKPMTDSIAPDGIILLIGGGLCYSLGVIFYLWKTLVYHHAIWHLFVLAGSILHFFSVFLYVIP